MAICWFLSLLNAKPVEKQNTGIICKHMYSMNMHTQNPPSETYFLKPLVQVINLIDDCAIQLINGCWSFFTSKEWKRHKKYSSAQRKYIYVRYIQWESEKERKMENLLIISIPKIAFTGSKTEPLYRKFGIRCNEL